MNVTVPVALVEETVAVNVVDWPKLVGLTDEVSVVVVEIMFICSVRLLELLPVKFVSPG